MQICVHCDSFFISAQFVVLLTVLPLQTVHNLFIVLCIFYMDLAC